MQSIIKVIMAVLVLTALVLIVTHSSGFAQATGSVSSAALSEEDILAGYVPVSNVKAGGTNPGGLGTGKKAA